MENLSETYKILIGLTATGLLLIPAIIFFNKYEQRRQSGFIDKMALIMHNMYQKLIVTDFDLFPIDSNNFSILDLNFYNSRSSNLVLNKFRLIGDFEEANFKIEHPNILCFSRYLISEDDTINAIIYHLKIGKSSLKSIEFLTEFTNGTVLITSNNFLYSKVEHPDEIEYSFKNTDSSDVLLKHHKNGIQHIQIAKNSGVQRISNIDEIIKQQRIIKLKENKFRQSIKKEDIIKEVRRFLVGTKNEQLLAKISERIIELKIVNDK